MPLARPDYRRRLHRQPGVDSFHGGDLAIGHPGKSGGDKMSPHQGSHDQAAPNDQEAGHEFDNEC
jgi:hypothetical protein